MRLKNNESKNSAILLAFVYVAPRGGTWTWESPPGCDHHDGCASLIRKGY